MRRITEQRRTGSQQDMNQHEPTEKSGAPPVAELVRQYPEFITFREALKHSNPDWRPIISVWDRINVQALGVGISEALTGRKTAEAALKDVVPVVEKIMRHEGLLA